MLACADGVLQAQSTEEAWEEHEWEERGADTSVCQHMVAGSFAGMVEHTVMFPMDTIKTHVQATEATRAVQAVKASARGAESARSVGVFGVARELVSLRGKGSLWRGMTVALRAVVPAHALMFASYEGVLYYGGTHSTLHAEASPLRVGVVGFAAGGISTLFHDSIMVPAETIKQR